MISQTIRTLTTAAVAGGVALAASATVASELSTHDVLVAAEAKRGAVHGATWNLTVEEAGGTAAKLEVQARDDDFLATYQAPAAQRGEKILERGQNMWFIKPGVRNPVPISPRQKLLGAASYGDIAAQRWTSDYTVTHAHDSVLDGEPVHVIDLQGGPRATYDMITLYIDSNDLYAVKSEMKTAEGRLLKTATYAYNNRVPGRYEAQKDQPDDSEFISEMVITPVDGNETRLSYSGISFRHISAESFLITNVMQ